MSGGVCIGMCSLVAETDDAIYVCIEQIHQYRWIPRSQIHESSDRLSKHLNEGYLTVTQWLADKEGWIECSF